MTDNPHTNPPALILASSSPRRRELLAGLEFPFTVSSPAIDETAWSGEAPASFALRMAHEKAATVVATLSPDGHAVVIAADTIVVLNNRIMGKPADEAEAAAMLHDLSDQRHHVITGLCVWECRGSHHHQQGDAVRTAVTFRSLTSAEIHHYIASGEPMDKAGAYAIQGGAAGMVDHIDGSYSNVVGLPMETLARRLNQTHAWRSV